MMRLGDLFKPRFPSEVRVVARFEGRIEGEGHPVGTAVSGDSISGETQTALSRIVCADQSTLEDRVRQANIAEFDKWIAGEGPDPVPRAIIRLLADLAVRGENLSDQPTIFVYWHPGIPPRSVWDGPATLAQIIGIPIKLFYETDRMMVITFEP